MDNLLIIYLLFIHWLGDFVFQSQRMAKNKNTNNLILFQHCFVYGITFIVFTQNIVFGLLMGLIHFPVDYVSSRINAYFFKKSDIHNFFVCIGFDQLIHMATIILIGEKIL